MSPTRGKNFVVVPITHHELDATIAMIRESLDPFEEAGSVLAATYRRLSNFTQVYDGDSGIYLIAKEEDSGALVGGAGFGPFVGLSPDEKIGEIRELVVKRECRGQGAAKLLLKQCLNYAAKQGYSRIYLETTPQMEHAQNLFKRFKFKPVTQSLGGGSQGSLVPCYFMLEGP